MRKRAQVLTELTHNPVPILELLGEPAPPANLARSTDGNFLTRENLAQGAVALRLAIESGSFSHLSVSDKKDVLTFTTPKAQCEKPGVPQAWMSAVREVAGRTTPFLPAGDLALVWQAIHTSPCYEQMQGMDRTVLEFFEALAMRNREAIVSRGTTLLAEGNTLSESMQGDVILGVAAALLGGDDPQAGVKFLQERMPFVEREREKNLAIRLIEAVAIAHMKKATAG